MKRLTFLSVLVILLVALVSNLAVPIPSASANDLPRGLNGDSPNELPIPVIDVMPEIDSVAGWKWQPGIQVTITINGANYYATPDSSGEFDTGTIGYDIKAGDLVQVSDGTSSKDHKVYPLDLTSYNIVNDTLTGKAEPNRELGAWVCTLEDCDSLTTTADATGDWELDFTGERDIAPGSDGEIWQPDDDDDYTVIFWKAPPLPSAFNKTFPANGATNRPRNLTLSWQTNSGATGYQYCLKKVGLTCTWISTGTNTSKLLIGLASAKYQWQVRAKNESGTTTANSGIWWSFTVPPKPGAFGKTSPATNSINKPTSLTLYWAASTNAAKYEYCIKKSLSATCTWKPTALTRHVSLTGLERKTMYYWQVRAKNAVGTTLANSSTFWNFKTAP